MVMAWPKLQNAEKVAVGGDVAAERTAAGWPLLTTDSASPSLFFFQTIHPGLKLHY